MKPYHNKGFLPAALIVLFLLVGLPFVIGYLTWGKDWVKLYMKQAFPERCKYEDNKHNVIDTCNDK